MLFTRALPLVFALCASPLAAQDDTAEADAPPPPKVSIAAAYSEDITQEAVFIAKGEAVDKVDVIARVEGFLRERKVADGADVQAGETLFMIEPEQYQATLEAAKAELARAEANLRLAQIELDRKRQLVERETAPQSELDIALANELVREADIKSAQATIQQAELDLSYTNIVAPFDGRLGRLEVSVGDIVGPNTGTLAVLVRRSPIYVSFSLSEKQLTDIQEDYLASGGDPDTAPELQVTVDLPNGSQLNEIGTIAFAENRIDPATGTLKVRAKFDNADRLLLDGGFVNVHLASSETVSKVLVPQAAVQRDQKGDFVLVVNDKSIVEQRYITTGEQHGIAMIVEEGLREGESVIVEGLQRVRPGVPVQAIVSGSEE